MTFLTFLYLAILIILTMITILGGTFIYKRYISSSYDTIPFTDLVVILRFLIDGELKNYDDTIFKQKGSITNSNFENFYNDITKHIISSIPENFYVQMSKYLSREAVIRIICRDVRKYLIEKV